MQLKRVITGSFIFLFVFSFLARSQSVSLPRGNAAQEGFDPAAMIKFLDTLAKTTHEFHSIMIVRHGKIVAEGWWAPYEPGMKHTMYSLSKSFTSTAIGFAVAEKKLKVTDKVITFFPDDVPQTVSPMLASLTVKHLLSMTVGQQPDPTGIVSGRDSNWVRGFLSVPIVHEPGSKFLYNSLGTYMLSAIIQKVTGTTVLEYLKPRLFRPLGIDGADWETDPAGINTGGWGLRIRTEDIAKLGQLYLQQGKWMGKQLLPLSWVSEATMAHIEQDPQAPQSRKDSSDWLQGYGYQFWRSRHHSYRGDGAFGQYMLILPDHDAVIAITSETTNMQTQLNLIWKYLLPGFTSGNKPSPALVEQMKARLKSLSITPRAQRMSADSVSITGTRSFAFENNSAGYKSVTFAMQAERIMLTLETDTAKHEFPFGKQRWEYTTTNRLGPSLVAQAKNHFRGIGKERTAGSYRWLDPSTLELTLRYIESPHTEYIVCRFTGEGLTMELSSSIDARKKVFKGNL